MIQLRLLPLLLLPLLCTSVRAQKAYFQQEVRYEIDVRLDDKKQELHGHLELTYDNNSPDTLRAIPFHCWPRAYSSDRTAFARQKLRQGETKFHFAPTSKRGTMDSLFFTVDGIKATFDFEEIDVAMLTLPQPLLPGGRTVVSTPFRVKIPESFSRLGRVGESYQITQWYPKPAVYDRAGWHAMPYLDLGEYYADFGDFKVNITLPENYIVGATGVLTTKDERKKLLDKAAADRVELARRAEAGELSTRFVQEEFPASSATFKTLAYRAENVHDFAWFADKRFKVLHDTLVLARPPDAGQGFGEQGGTVDVWALFNETEAGLWIKATDYLKQATRFYSEQVGVYPHPQVTGVMSALSVGGGMEYPMITVIGRSSDAADLDEVLAHEVGHNWFQGILGSNERDHPWMDEGINSFYEQRYMAKYWPERKNSGGFFGEPIDYNHLSYHLAARRGLDQAPDTRSDSLAEFNYWLGAYTKPAMALKELEEHVGTEAFDRAMQTYYNQWKFRHPQPADFFQVMDEQLQFEEGPWFKQGLLTTKTSDWQRLKDGVQKHKGERRPPVPAGSTPNELDLYPGNDYVNKKLSVILGIAQEDPEARQFFALPLAGFNEHDGPLLGAALHNRTMEPRKLEWIVAPMYGFESKRLNGLIGAQYRKALSEGKVRQMMVNLGVQRFSDFTLRRTDEVYDYVRIGAGYRFDFRHEPIREVESCIFFQYVNLSRKRPVFTIEGEVADFEFNHDAFYRVGYRRYYFREINPLVTNLRLEYKSVDEATPFNANHLRLDAEVSGGYQYEPGRFLRYRAYGGVFLANELRESAARIPSGFSLVDNANSDYAYDDLYLGRNRGSLYEQQLGRRQGGFRAPISSAFSFGTSNSYLTAVNIDADIPALPEYLPIGLFLDAGYYGFKALGNDPLRGEFSWVGGVSLTAAKGRVGLFLPLVANPDTKELLEQRGSLLDRASVRLNLVGWAPWKWVDELF